MCTLLKKSVGAKNLLSQNWHHLLRLHVYVLLQGTFCVEKCMGGMGKVLSGCKWSLNKRGPMGRFDCTVDLVFKELS